MHLVRSTTHHDERARLPLQPSAEQVCAAARPTPGSIPPFFLVT